MSKNNLFYTNGDSFIFGMECIAHRSRNEFNKTLAFANSLRTALNYETYVNNAYLGATNDFIFKQTIFDLEEFEANGHKPSETFVLLGWTSLYRIEVDGNRWLELIPDVYSWIEENRWNEDFPEEYNDFNTMFVNPNSGMMLDNGMRLFDIKDDVLPFCAQYLWTDHLLMKQQDARIIAMHEYLKNKGYKHLFVNTVAPYTSSIKCPNYFELESNSFAKFALENYPNEQREQHHFSPIPHDEYAKILFEYINKHNLIN